MLLRLTMSTRVVTTKKKSCIKENQGELRHGFIAVWWVHQLLSRFYLHVLDPYSANNLMCLRCSSVIQVPNESTLRQNFQQIQEGEGRQANRPVLLPAYKPGAPQQAAEQPRAKPSPVPQPRTDVARSSHIADQEQHRMEQAPPPQPKMGRLIRKPTRFS